MIQKIIPRILPVIVIIVILVGDLFAVDVIFGPKIRNNSIPWFGRPYDAVTSQHLYMQSDIGTYGKIISFAWENIEPLIFDPEGEYRNVRIYMGHTSRSAFVSTFADNYTGPRTLVFSRAAFTTGGPPDTWNDIVLDTPFLYNNVDNLIIEVRWNGDDDRNVTLWCGYWTGHGDRCAAYSDTATAGFLTLDYVYRVKLTFEDGQPTPTHTVTPMVTATLTPSATETPSIPVSNPLGIILFFSAVIPLFLLSKRVSP